MIKNSKNLIRADVIVEFFNCGGFHLNKKYKNCVPYTGNSYATTTTATYMDCRRIILTIEHFK